MKIIVASDSFKGSLSSAEVGQAVANAASTHEVQIIPIADGGEGTLSIIAGETIWTKATNPIGKEINARYKITGNKAFIEMAEVAGLCLLNPEERNPELTSTYGLGELIKHAIESGIRNFYIGIGGSATNDAGIGMLTALGYKFRDKNNQILKGIGASLEHIFSIDESEIHPQLTNCKFTIACDVSNPFSGKNGAAHIYAPQKGADTEMVKRLDKGLEHFRQIILSKYKIDLNQTKGAGAAGGIGGAFKAFLHADLQAGIDFLLALIDFEKKITDADLIITGEGCMDTQTLMGKAPIGILNIAKKHKTPVIGIAGKVKNKRELLSAGFAQIIEITPADMSLSEAMKKENATENIGRSIRNLLQEI